MTPHHGVGAVAQMRGERSARAYRVRDLLGSGVGMADAGHYAFGGDGFDITERLRPIGRQRHDANLIAGGILPAVEFIQIRRAHPAEGMRAARAVVGRDVRTFNMEAIDGHAFAQASLWRT